MLEDSDYEKCELRTIREDADYEFLEPRQLEDQCQRDVHNSLYFFSIKYLDFNLITFILRLDSSILPHAMVMKNVIVIFLAIVIP